MIDLLFLSHFHADHVNGLDELKRCYPIRTVILPKLTEEARILAKLENYLAYAGFSTLLLDDPQAYFGERTIVILVEAIGEQGLVAGKEHLDALPIVLLPQVDQPNGPVAPDSATRTARELPVIPSGTPIQLRTTVAPFWEYIPYNYEFASRRPEFVQLLDALGIELAALSTLEQVLGAKKQLTGVYRKLDGDLNENSLVVYSGPLSLEVSLLHKSRAHEYWPHFYRRSHEAGCLYLGDADLSASFIVPDLRRRLGDRWPHILTIQVPHHGAVRNFSPAIVEPGMLAVLSFGTANPYGHPSTYVIGQLHRLRVYPVLVTEHLETALYSNA